MVNNNYSSGTLSKEDGLILETVRTAGWGLISQKAKARISAIEQELCGKKFEDLAAIARLQGELKALKTYVHYGESRIEKLEKINKERAK